MLFSSLGNTSKIWEFFAVLVVNISAEQTSALLGELRDIINMTPMNPTLAAFLQLSGVNVNQ